jgi:hypothetical protein
MSIHNTLSNISSKESYRLDRDYEYNTKCTIKRVFGFNVDKNKSAAINAERILDDEPQNVFKVFRTNLAFHNLCPAHIQLPVGTRALLGLGMKFCIERPRPYQDLCSALGQFKRDVDLRMFLVQNDLNEASANFNRRLYKKTDWNPEPCEDPHASAFQRFENMVNDLRNNIPTYRRYNLRPIHRRALSAFKKMNMAICYSADKGLGPYVVHRPDYIKQGFTEHLTNKYNYVRLLPEEAVQALSEQKKQFKKVYNEEGWKLDDDHQLYFKRCFKTDCKEGSKTPIFYGLWKVHKDKPAMRPVISCCGSFPEIFSIYIDECLKRLVQDVLTTYIISADQLVNTLSTTFPGPLPLGAKLFSVDAVGMYCNIDTDHGIEVTEEFMRRYSDQLDDFDIPKEFIIRCLRIVMKMNIFRFGDTFWKQVNGTAMGTSCAVNYAFLYMGLLEMLQLSQRFSTWLPFYGRFIDDGIGVWLTLKQGSAQAWEEFKASLNNWGKLKWTNTGHVDSLQILDLTVSINSNRCLEFKTYRKPMNLHLYLPPNSAHPPDTIRSLVFGRVRAYFLHNTHDKDFKTECYTLARDLIRCGWEWEDLASHFNDAHESLKKHGRVNLLEEAMKTRREKEAEKPDEQIMVFKLPFHPRGVQRRQITTAYRLSGLANLQPERRFICAQLRPHNVRDRVSSTALEDIPGANPSDYLIANPIN